MLLLAIVRGPGLVSAESPKADHWFQYTNEVIDDIPWSIHIVRLERASQDFRFVTTSGGGKVLGMGTVSEQLTSLSRDLGPVLAAINGDFYDKSQAYQGRPRDLQIRQGEVVSSPAGHTCFWIGPDSAPHMTNVYSRFHVVWPDGKTTPIGLNEARADEAAVLYTAVLGASTRTRGGRELVLDTATNAPRSGLRIGQTTPLIVREIRESGDTPITTQRMVLSLGPELIPHLPQVNPGDIIQVVTATSPPLSDVDVAIGGGPSLVHDRKPMQWNGFIHLRHPRTAFGWNKDYFFLVEVDGRQSNISVGMTFPELADYLVKLGCEEAMNLDGGGSATLWALGSVRNSPSEGDERPSANALVVVRKPAPPK